MLTDSEAALARAVLIHGPISRSALTHRLGLSPASLTRLAKPFLDRGHPGRARRRRRRIGGAADATARRRARLRPFHRRQAHRRPALRRRDRHPGLCAGSSRARAASAPIPPPSRTPSSRRSTTSASADLAGLGISIGGSVRDGVVEQAPFLGWHDVDLGSELSRRSSASPSRSRTTSSRSPRPSGGSGSAAASRVSRSSRSAPASATGSSCTARSCAPAKPGLGLGGHLPLAANGPVCHAGHRGCAEAMLTSGSIAAQVSAALQRPVGYAEVLALARAGDPAARAVVDAAADALGRFIALAANLTLQHVRRARRRWHRALRRRRGPGRAAIAADRDPLADPIAVHVDDWVLGWARGAAAVAIQAAVARLDFARYEVTAGDRSLRGVLRRLPRRSRSSSALQQYQ